MDGRSDIYALGCVVYEMLAGEAPFAGATDRAVLARHAVDSVPPIRTIRPGISPELEQAVLRALAKVPADRPSEAGRYAASLVAAAAGSGRKRQASRWTRFLPLLGLLMVAVLPFAFESPRGPARPLVTAARARPHVSVGPFANRTGSPALDPLGSLVASWLTWGLAASGAVEVVDSSASHDAPLPARGRPTGARSAGPRPAELIVAGSYYRAGDSIELHATVTDVRTGRVIYASEPVFTDEQNPGESLGQLRASLLQGIAESR
jgi:hypothetical protein